MQTETAADLLDAVGYNRETSEHFDTAFRCSVCRETTDGPVGRVSRCYAYKGHSKGGEHAVALAPTYEYTGPALGTPELDAILLVAGQRWLRDAAHSSKRDVAKNLRYDSFEQDSGGWISGRLGLMFQSPLPGHALARAIAEVGKA